MRRVLGMSVVVLLAACGASPQDVREIRDGQREIRAKLDQLAKKVDQIASRRAAPARRQQADPNKVYNIPAGNSPFKGPTDAPVILAEFSDFQWPYCRQVPSLVDQVLKAYPKEVKFVYKQFPLVRIHANAMNAAKASLAAHKQGKFWEFHDKLFANQRALGVDSLKTYAQEIDLDMAAFEKEMNSPEVQRQVDEEMRLAQASQVRGTPTLFVNGKLVTNRSFDGIKQMVDAALKGKR